MKLTVFALVCAFSIIRADDESGRAKGLQARGTKPDGSEPAAMFVSWLSQGKRGISLYDPDTKDGYKLRTNVDLGDKPLNGITVNNAADRIYLMVLQDKSHNLVTYAPDPSTGKFAMISNVSTGAAAILKTTLDPDEKYILVSDNHNGNLLIYPINADDKTPDKDGVKVVKPPGNVVPEDNFPSVITFHPKHQNIFVVVYTGSETLYFYDFNKDDGSATLIDVQDLPKFTKPKFAIFSNQGTFMYVMSFTQEVSTYRLTFGGSGDLTEVKSADKITTKPQGSNVKGITTLVVTDDDEYLYALNYEDGSLVMFKNTKSSGKLKSIGFVMTDCGATSDLAIIPGKKQVAVTCFGGNKILLYAIPENGILSAPSVITDTNGPTSIFIPEPLKK